MLKVAAVELSSPIAVLISLKSYYSSFHNWDVSSVKQINILVFLTMFLREDISGQIGNASPVSTESR
jgi:hypothetical protein